MKAFAQRLKRERAIHAWSQEQVAEMVGTTAPNVSRWERGLTLPSLYYRQKLSELFGRTPEELGLFEVAQDQKVQAPAHGGRDQARLSSSPQAALLRGNLPYPRNPLFTGREEALHQLHRALTSSQVVAVTQAQAITGLGGIGKTALALEYAYRYGDGYQTLLWIQAETRDILLSDLAALAGFLHLPEQGQTQQQTIEAVKQWFAQHSQWLLIIDNLEEVALLREFMPFHSQGKIIVTTRVQAISSFMQCLDLDTLAPDQGALFLLRRAKRIGPADRLEQAAAADQAAALELAHFLDGLPLALDQAGAYIEEAACSLAHYVALFQRFQTVLLGLRALSEGASAEHPGSVQATLTFSLERLPRESPAALPLLQLCAFLHAEAIPEELLEEGAPELGPLLEGLARDPLQLDATIAHLRRYSLLHRHPEARTLSLHRLVQVVVRGALGEASQREWAERVVRLVNRAFPQQVVYATWEQCQRLLPHALCGANLIEQWDFTFPEAAHLLSKVGNYLQERGSYAQAQPLLESALVLREQIFGFVHLDVADSLNQLGTLYRRQGKFIQAQPLLKRALALRKQALGPTHPDVAESLNELAVLYLDQGKYPQAQPLLKRALALREQALGPTHPDVADNISNLAANTYYLGRYDQALPLFRRALAIGEQVWGSDHPDVAVILNNLASLYYAQSKYAQALPFSQRALAIREQRLAPTHPDVAVSLNNLANLYRELGTYEAAFPLYQRALTIWEQVFGSAHPSVAAGLHSLAACYRAQGQYAEALPLYQRALSIDEQTLGPAHPEVATDLNSLALLYRDLGKDEEACLLFERALAIWEQALGPTHPTVARCLEQYAALLRTMQQPAQAEALEARDHATHPNSRSPT